MTFVDQQESYYSGRPERLFLFQMGDTAWPYVGGDTVVNFLSREFQPTAVDMGDISQSLSESTPIITVTIESDAAVCQQFVPYQPVRPMSLRVYRHHIDDPDNEYRVELIGKVVSAQFDEETRTCELTVQLAGGSMERRIPWPVTQKQCNYALYGPGCQVNRLLFQVMATLSSVTGDELRSPDFATKPDGWFTNGYVVAPNGEFRFIIHHETNLIVLQTPFVDVAANDIVESYAGCSRLRDVCKNKFNNLSRFLGFPWIPNKNPFADSVFGNDGNSTAKSSTNWRKAINPAGWNGSWGLF